MQHVDVVLEGQYPKKAHREIAHIVGATCECDSRGEYWREQHAKVIQGPRGEMYSCKYFYKYELILLQMFTTPNTIIDILKYLYCSTYLYKLKCS